MRRQWADAIVSIGLAAATVLAVYTLVTTKPQALSSETVITVVVPTQVIQWPTATTTPTPRPTMTPYPTIPPAPTVPAYRGQTTPGLYVIPARTISVPTSIIEWPLCTELAATPMAPAYDRTCEVR